jgi:hypothetical protein
MLGGEKQPEPWKSTVKFIGRCPICNTEYKPEAARFFAEQNSSRLLHITCEKCQSHFVAMVVFAGQGLSSVGAITDLNYEDVTRLYRLPAVSLDEVIGCHEFLKDNLIKI